MKLLIGCPVRARDWVLPSWFSHVEDACWQVKIDPEYVFVIDNRDVLSENVMRQVCATNDRTLHVVHVNEDGAQTDNRVWNESRYHHMVFLRNQLLKEVRQHSPDWFLSLDSDILLHPKVLTNLLETAADFSAVGGKTYMTSGGRGAPSYANLINSAGLLRPDFDGVIRVEVIMAIKLMTPAAYGVDYCFHFQGEDIGWSLACADAKLNLAWDGRIASKHVMEPSELNRIDQRCGY